MQKTPPGAKPPVLRPEHHEQHRPCRLCSKAPDMTAVWHDALKAARDSTAQTRRVEAATRAVAQLAAETRREARRGAPRNRSRLTADLQGSPSLTFRMPAPAPGAPTPVLADLIHPSALPYAENWRLVLDPAPPRPCHCGHAPAEHSATPGAGCPTPGCLCLDDPTLAGPMPPAPDLGTRFADAAAAVLARPERPRLRWWQVLFGARAHA